MSGRKGKEIGKEKKGRREEEKRKDMKGKGGEEKESKSTFTKVSRQLTSIVTLN